MNRIHTHPATLPQLHTYPVPYAAYPHLSVLARLRSLHVDHNNIVVHLPSPMFVELWLQYRDLSHGTSRRTVLCK
ncbi:hypothetical protein Pelo_14471 [Pelomyxa schiedti]|nr:hypothetical protein Pelo_14471 [Pelomyxa schiedti]